MIHLNNTTGGGKATQSGEGQPHAEDQGSLLKVTITRIFSVTNKYMSHNFLLLFGAFSEL